MTMNRTKRTIPKLQITSQTTIPRKQWRLLIPMIRSWNQSNMLPHKGHEKDNEKDNDAKWRQQDDTDDTENQK